MMWKHICIITIFVVIKNITCQSDINTACLLKISDDFGVCRIILDCPKIMDDVIKNQRLPQTCGFRGTQAIVCCPLDNISHTREPGEISDKKCRQYSSSVSNTTCGHRIVKRIIGGIKAHRYEFPHMVALGFPYNASQIKWGCGGSLISEQFIVTTADCLITREYGWVKYAKIGATNLNDAEQIQLNIIERIIHPDYTPVSKYNNIGLLKLEKPIDISRSVKPACLHTGLELPEQGVATGWGTINNASLRSDDLFKVSVPIVTHDVCSKTYRNGSRTLKQGILKESQFCAGTVGKDTCQGDGGGPLQIDRNIDNFPCMYDIIGLTSFGRRCGIGPAVYTRISYYIKWIEDIVWPSFSQVTQ